MFFSIDPRSGISIYDQIVRQVKFAVANGALKPGEMLPSVRELARELALNHNTIARAYRELQAQNIVTARRGTGLEVTAQGARACREIHIKLIRQRLRGVFQEAKQSLMDLSELRDVVDEELARAYPEGVHA